MNWDRIEGNWKQLTGSAKEKWGRLTDDHLAVIHGQRTQMAGKLQELYGIGKDEAERQICEWEESVKDRLDKAVKAAKSHGGDSQPH